MPPTAAATFRSSITDTQRAPKKSTSHSRTMQMYAPHTHGVACCPCWTAVVTCCALCVLTVAMAAFMRGQKTDRMCTSIWVWYARMMCTYFFLFASKGCENPIPGGMRKPSPRGDAETPPPGMFRKPEDLPCQCPRQTNFKSLAIRDTLHGSRPNLRHRDRDGRIMLTPLNGSDKGSSRKRYVQNITE